MKKTSVYNFVFNKYCEKIQIILTGYQKTPGFYTIPSQFSRHK